MRQTMEKFKQQQEVMHTRKQQSEEEEDGEEDFNMEEDMGDDLEDYFASQIMQDI